jgi:hypothetical protein
MVIGVRFSFIGNNTVFRSALDCSRGNTSEVAACDGASGSVLPVDPSQGFRELLPDEFASRVLTVDDLGYTSINKGLVDANFTSFIIPLPVEVYSAPSETLAYGSSPAKSYLSFGPLSSFLKLLLDNAHAPSSYISMFIGSRSQSAPMEGEVIVGGFRPERLASPWHNFSTNAAPLLSFPCTLRTMVNGITLKSNNSQISLLNQPLPGCFDTVQASLGLPKAPFEMFQAATRHTNESPQGQRPMLPWTYPIELAEFLSSFEIQIELQNYTLIIPAVEIFGLERGPNLTSQGEYTVLQPENGCFSSDW